MPRSEAQKRADKKYEAKVYDKYGIRFKKDELSFIKGFATAHGESLNAFIVEAVRDKIRRLQNAPESTQREE